ncbi:hypothetical protein RGQ15_14950 [Paracoccus sp. MBLB3053]|uniref:HD domain-containing protein n=1 Tax=Paracoccus aurantius TaxID=3073814 RepID=A0ABU2HUY7_9RHOB|nr:hypothetical protein [Paracoccus sp. MBLB3053]MDS9468862.1 hypothetical protein [Paracoccus sp. MBLB3053]
MDLEQALQIAAEAHRGQCKNSEPFILHPVRVMLACATPHERIVAILHDVVEKSAWTLDDLRAEGLPDDQVEAVDAMSRRDGEDYLAFVTRAGRNPIARQVKIADLRDNLEMASRPDASSETRQKSAKYRHALDLLAEAGPGLP